MCSRLGSNAQAAAIRRSPHNWAHSADSGSSAARSREEQRAMQSRSAAAAAVAAVSERRASVDQEQAPAPSTRHPQPNDSKSCSAVKCRHHQSIRNPAVARESRPYLPI